MIPSKALASSPATHNFDGASNGSKLTYFKVGKILTLLQAELSLLFVIMFIQLICIKEWWYKACTSRQYPTCIVDYLENLRSWNRLWKKGLKNQY